MLRGRLLNVLVIEDVIFISTCWMNSYFLRKEKKILFSYLYGLIVGTNQHLSLNYRCKITLNSATQWGRVTCAFRQGNYLVTGKHGVENSFS